MRTIAVLPVKRFDDAKQRLDATLSAGTRRALAEAMVTDVLHALRRAERIDGVVVVTGESGAEALARAYDAERSPTTTAATRTRRAPASTGRSSAAPSACCSCPATARRSTRRGRRAAGRRHERAGVVIVPDRHGTGTNALLLAPPDAIAPSFGPGSRERHEEAAAPAARAGGSRELPSLVLDVDTAEDLAVAARRARRAHRRRRAHARAAGAARGWAACGARAMSRAAWALAACPRCGPGDDLAALLARRRAARRRRARASPTRSSRRPRARSSRSATSSRSERARELARDARQGPAPRAGRPRRVRRGRARGARRAHLPHAPRVRVRQRGRRRVERARDGTLVAPPPRPRRERPRAARRAPGRPRRRDRRLVRPRLAPRPVRRGDRRGRPRAARRLARAPRRAGRELRATSIAIADEAAAAADLARAKDSREPAVVVRGLGRHVTDDDGPGAAALMRPAPRTVRLTAQPAVQLPSRTTVAAPPRGVWTSPRRPARRPSAPGPPATRWRACRPTDRPRSARRSCTSPCPGVLVGHRGRRAEGDHARGRRLHDGRRAGAPER